MCDTGVASDSIDVVTGGYALRNAPDLSSALAEVMRVLRPGGVAMFLDFSKPKNRWLQRAQYAGLYLWGSFWGLVLHANPEVYAYIAKSLQKYPDRRQLHCLVRDQGFDLTGSRTLFFGAIELLTLKKPAIDAPAPKDTE